MLTAEQINALRDKAAKLVAPIQAYLLREIVRRVAHAGQMTSTAAYQVWKAQQLGVSQRQIKQEMHRLLKLSHKEIRRIMYQSAQSGYNLDVSRFPQVQAIPFQQNTVLQQIVSAAAELAEDDFTNLTQTMGMVDPYGNALPLQDAYRACTDFAFELVSTGAADYMTAIRQATKNLADKGLRVIDYESGLHTSLEAAVRRNIMGGLGLMQEKIIQETHDQLRCNGWEITAHANSAPDHEPIQGKQYSDEAYTALNNSLRRRIGTLNCGHATFPIILGVNRPQYTAAELEKFRQDNKKGVTIDGRHYTGYEATQMQRRLERAIRRQKNRIMVDEAAGDDEKLKTDKTRLTILRQRYVEFSRDAGLRTQYERTEVAGFGEKQDNSLANSTNSGIMAVNRLEEIPEVRRARGLTSRDVTGEYLSSATPGQGAIIYEAGYRVKGHQAEIDMADWIHHKFGEDITLLKESDLDSVKRPDYFWKGAFWELKGAASINGADKLLQHAIKQIQDNPGGVILNVLENIDKAALERQLARRIERSKISAIDLIILQKGNLEKVLRYNK